MNRLLLLASLVALLPVPAGAAPRTTVTLVRSDEAVPRSGAPALAVAVRAADAGLAAALDAAVRVALASHSHAAVVSGDASPYGTLTVLPEPPVRRDGLTVLAFTASLAGSDGREVWAVTGTVEDDGTPSPEAPLASLARNLVDRLIQDGWAHARRDPANPAPPPPRVAVSGTGAGPR